MDLIIGGINLVKQEKFVGQYANLSRNDGKKSREALKFHEKGANFFAIYSKR